ncbi:MAG TPA: type II secretion system protein [Candidatus Nitrosotenuis sp.]|nr:type II secretion system protein [Candidatus Nitrosotenuis sp.]
MSLLELVVALGVFAVAFLVVMSIFPTSAMALRQGQEVLVATHLAEEALEEARRTPYDELADRVSTVQVASTSNGVTTTSQFAVQTLVTEVEPGLARVRALVSWDGALQRHVELVTYVARTP